ncbi:hypothetical protein [Brachybacterium huguangmaarense]
MHEDPDARPLPEDHAPSQDGPDAQGRPVGDGRSVPEEPATEALPRADEPATAPMPRLQDDAPRPSGSASVRATPGATSPSGRTSSAGPRADVEPRRPVVRRPSRRLQWLAVVPGFLFFVTLLLEAALLALDPPASALRLATDTGVATGENRAWILGVTGALVVFGLLAMLFGAACVGRYRFLTKLGGLLLFAGVAVRLVWPVALHQLLVQGALDGGKVLGHPVLPDPSQPAGAEPLVPAWLLPHLEWWVFGIAGALTFFGLVGLVVTRPKPLAPDADNEDALDEVLARAPEVERRRRRR